MAAKGKRSRKVAVAFVIFALTPFAIAATRSSFWERQHSMAPAAAALYLAVVLALVVGRYRWAWVLLLLFYVSADLTWAVRPHVSATYALGLALALPTLALLLSRPMRHRLRRPITLRGL